jgi:hypothetical protein
MNLGYKRCTNLTSRIEIRVEFKSSTLHCLISMLILLLLKQKAINNQMIKSRSATKNPRTSSKFKLKQVTLSTVTQESLNKQPNYSLSPKYLKIFLKTNI